MYSINELILIYCQVSPFLNFILFFLLRYLDRIRIFEFFEYSFKFSITLSYRIYVISNLLFIGLFGIYFFFMISYYNYNYVVSLFEFSGINLYFRLRFDIVSICMLVLVGIVSCVVHSYSIWYMSHDLNINKFLAYLSFFTGSMLLLVLGDNYLQMFIGWEFVGVSSFLLIGFWDQRREAIRSACKALFLNKIGDVFFLIGIILMYRYSNNLNVNGIYLDTLTQYELISGVYLIDIVGFCLFMAAVAKSAQLGLHMWLIDAMEGPTPVSALIHAATMVTAGIFLLIRSNFIIINCSFWLIELISIWGILTAFVGGFLAMFQYDIKKIIAYSTMSQLGYMLSVVCIDPMLSLYHLVNHGWFKALLFLSAGVVIHMCNNEQDIRGFSPMLYKKLPLTFLMFVFGSLSMIAVPLTSGFFSKDVIYEVLYVSKYLFYFYNLLYLVGFFTITYSIRLIYYVFFRKSVVTTSNKIVINDPLYVVFCVYIVLGFMTICSGYIYMFVFSGLNFFVDMLLYVGNITYMIILLIYFGFFFNKVKLFMYSNIYIKIFGLLINRLSLDIFFNMYVYVVFMRICWFIYFFIEMGWVQYFGPMIVVIYRYFGQVFSLLELFDSFKVTMLGYLICMLFFIII